MFPKLGGITLVFSLLAAGGISVAQEPKKSSTIIGEVKGQKDTKDGKNTMIDILAPGEEKARSYHVNYDPKIKGPIPSVLSAVRHAKIGERVELDWIGTNHGPAITAFRVLKKGSENKDRNEKQVTAHKTPGHGIQPQAVIDGKGVLHVLYFQGEAKAGNLMYVRREAGKFTHPLRVNSQENSAIATGTIRGGHIALGKNGRVHVAWNGAHDAQPKNPIAGMPMLYARMNDEGTAFETQRNLMTQTSILDGGGSLAADNQGNVYVGWHAIGKDSAKGEDNRKLWISVSSDDGKTFAAEKSAWEEATGACGCCGIRGFADKQGNAFFLYRAASEKINRGMYVVRSADQGKSFAGLRVDNWKIDHCPMSSVAFAEGPTGIYAAWDTAGKIYFTRIQPSNLTIDTPKAAPGHGDSCKHPALAVNKNGDMIIVWTEGTGWNRGGVLAWQVYDKSGNPTSESGRRPGAIPVWGLPTVVAELDGRFTILH